MEPRIEVGRDEVLCRALVGVLFLLNGLAEAAVQSLYLPSGQEVVVGPGRPPGRIRGFCTDHDLGPPSREDQDWLFIGDSTLETAGGRIRIYGHTDRRTRRFGLVIEPTGQLDGDVAFKIAVPTLAIPKSSLPKPDELTALRAHFAASSLLPRIRRVSALHVRRSAGVDAFDEAARTVPVLVRRPDEDEVGRPPRRLPIPDHLTDYGVGRWLLGDFMLVHHLGRFPTRLSLMHDHPENVPRMVAFLLVNNLVKDPERENRRVTDFSRFRAYGRFLRPGEPARGDVPDGLHPLYFEQFSGSLSRAEPARDSPFRRASLDDEDLVVEPGPEPGEWATVPGTGSTSSEHRKRLRKQRRDRDHYLYFGAGKSTEFPFGTSGTELLLDVRRPLGDVHPHLSVNSNVVLPDGDLGFWDFENPSGDVGADIDAVLRSIPPSQHLAGEEAKVWIASGVFSYRRLTWPDDRKFLLVSEDWKTSRYLPRLRGRALKPETADWFLGLETLQREGLLDAIEYGPKGVFFDAGGRTLRVGSEPPPPGQIQAVLGRLRTLIGLGHDFAFRDVATLTQDPCVIRIDAADPDGGKLTSLRREIDARRITNPMVFTTQGDLATSLDRLSAWPYWESFEAKVDGSILQGAGEERGKSITRMLDGLVIGQGGAAASSSGSSIMKAISWRASSRRPWPASSRANTSWSAAVQWTTGSSLNSRAWRSARVRWASSPPSWNSSIPRPSPSAHCSSSITRSSC